MVGSMILAMVRLPEDLHQVINILPGVHFSDSDQHVILERWIIPAQVISSQDAVFQQVGIQFRHRSWTTQGKFVEEGSGKTQSKARYMA